MKIKLTRDTVLGADKIGKAGEVVEVGDKQGRDLLAMKRGVEATEDKTAPPSKKAAKKAALAKDS